MLIQRRPPCSTTSTFGSAVGWTTPASPRERVERRSRGFGRFGMAASERVVVDRRHRHVILLRAPNPWPEEHYQMVVDAPRRVDPAPPAVADAAIWSSRFHPERSKT